MEDNLSRRAITLVLTVSICAVMISCGARPAERNINLANAGASTSNSNVNLAPTDTVNSNTVDSAIVETREPSRYQAKVTLTIEATGAQQGEAFPPLSAAIARSGDSRRMEFAMPAGGSTVFLDRSGTNFLILPEKKQYAQLDRDALGFDVRRLLMPENIVQQVKNVRGVQRIGEEKYKGRDAIKYRYAAVADTRTRAGQVETESFLLVDKETGLPLRSETASQSQDGGNVQGYNGLRIITEITDISTEVPDELFAEPTGLQKIESGEVRAQVDLIFRSVSMILGQLMKAGAERGPVR